MGVDCWNTFVVSKPAYSTVIMPGEINRRPGHERKTKFIRIFTVMTYICSVSIAAALLSLYYFFIWDPTTNNQNSTLVTRMSNNASHLFELSHSKSSSINATNPLLRPLLDGNCSLGSNTFGMFGKSNES